jgi:hypothetical protein
VAILTINYEGNLLRALDYIVVHAAPYLSHKEKKSSNMMIAMKLFGIK